MKRVQAEKIATLPEALHWRGGPNAWTEAARPGQHLHSFLEGPALLPGGDLLVADVPFGRIFRLSGGDWSIAWQGDGQPHSAKRLSDGRIAVADFLLGLRAVDLRSGRTETLTRGPNTEAFRGLSDLTIAGERIWLTDSGRSSLADPTGRVFLWDGRLRTALTNCPYPNGIATSPDGALVYVAMTRANAVWRFNADFAERPMAGLWVQLSGGLGPDGLAVDAQGRVAVAQAQAGRVLVFDAAGDPLARVDIGGPWTTAVVWDGPKLIVTEAKEGALWAAEL